MSLPNQATSYVNNASVKDTTAATQQWNAAYGTKATNYMLNNPARKQKTTTYDLPDAGYGQDSEFIGSTIDMQIVHADTWYTQVALPIKRRLNTKGITWNKFIFGPEHVDPIPMRGVSRLVSSRRETRTEGFLRYGLAFQMEHGYMETEEGRMQYQMHLVQIANAVDEANKFDVLHALVTAPRYEQEWTAKYGSVQTRDIRARFADEKMVFAILQKVKNGFEKLDSVLVRKMRRWRVDPTMYVFPEDAAAYLRLVPSEKTDYYMAGEAGPARLAQYDAAKPFVTYGKYRVYLARTYAVELEDDVDLLVRQRQIGEYGLLVDHYKGRDVYKHRSEDQSILMYDEDNDEFGLITLEHAIKYGQLFEKVYDKTKNKEVEKLRMPVPEHRVPHWKDDLKHDFLLRPAPQSAYGYEPIELFGEMAQSAFSTQSTLNLAETVINAVARGYLNGSAQVQAIMRTGLEVLENIAARNPTNEWMAAVSNANRGTETTVKDGRYIQENAKTVWARNSHGGFDLPDISDAPAAVKNGALAGFANWPGMLAMAREAGTANGSPTTAKGYASRDLQQIAELVSLIRSVVQVAGPVLRNSLVLDPKYTPLPFGKPSAEAVLVDNLLNLSGHAVWLRANYGQADAAGPASNAAAFQRDQKPFRDKIGRAVDAAGNLKAAQKTALVNLVANSLQGQTNESVATGHAFADAIEKLNVYKGGASAQARMSKFAETFLQDGNQNLDTLTKYIAANTGDFQGTTAQLKAFVTDLNSSVTAAARDNTALTAKYSDAPIAADVYASAPAPTSDTQFLRTPLMLSARQVVQLASDKTAANLPATVSAPNTMQTRAATAAELSRLVRRINAVNSNDTSAEARVAGAELMIEKDYGSMSRLEVVRLSRRGVGTGTRRARSLEDDAFGAEEERAPKRRRFSPALMREADGDAMEVADEPMRHQLYSDPEREDGGAYRGPTYGSYEGVLEDNFASLERKSINAMRTLIAKMYLLTPFSSEALLAMVEKHVLTPIAAIVARPYMRYGMKMCIKMVPGDQTGNMWIGHTYFGIQDDIKTQVQIGEYRYWGKAIVTEEKNVHVLYDVFCAERHGGAGLVPMDVDEHDPRNANYGNGDLLFFITPYEQTKYEDPIDTSGRFSYYDQASLDDRQNFENLHYTTAARYNGQLGFRTVRDTGYDVEDTKHPFKVVYKPNEYVPNVVPFNSVMWRTTEYGFNRATQQFDLFKRGTGHWGGFTYVGVRDARDGHFVPMREGDSTPVAIAAR